MTTEDRLALAESKLSLATAFTVGDHAGLNVTVEMTDNGHGPSSGDGMPRWAIRSGRECLNTAGTEWDYEPSPSNREDGWLRAHRFTDLDAALAMAQKAHAEVVDAHRQRIAERRSQQGGAS